VSVEVMLNLVMCWSLFIATNKNCHATVKLCLGLC